MRYFNEKVQVEQVFLESLESMVDYIPRMNDAIDQMVESFRSSDEGEGTILFQKAVDGLQWIQEIVSGQHAYLTNKLGIITPKELCVAEYQEKLAQLVQALEQQDYILMADVLEYELQPYLQQVWQHSTDMLEELNSIDSTEQSAFTN